MLRLRYISCFTAVAMTAVLLSGCIWDKYVPMPQDNTGNDAEFSDIVVRLRVGEHPATRSAIDPAGDEYTLGFTREEHEINTLTLIMMRVAGGREFFELSRTVDVSASGADAGSGGVIEAEFDLTGRKGLKRFYVGANMTALHIGAFTLNDKVINLDDDFGGHNVAGQLMTVDHGTGAGSNILMTGTLTVNGSRDILLDETNPMIMEVDGRMVLDLSSAAVRLDKAVAKVLVTGVTADDVTGGEDAGDGLYANVVDAKDYNGGNPSGKDNTGWVKMENLRYILNVMNLRTYPVYVENSDDAGASWLVDPNYEMSDFIEYREDRGGYGLKNLADYQKNFVYYDTESMVELLTSDETPADGDCRRSTVIPYDETRLDRNNPEHHYTDGLYCPENMVHKMPFNDGEDAEFMSVNRFVTTHIVIGARYTPKNIWVVDESGNLVHETELTEGEAKKRLPEISNYEMPEVGLSYPEGTFWYETNSMEYYSFEAMRLLTELKADAPESEKPAFTRYDGGWCYYFSFIDGEADPGGLIDYAGQERWGVKRNHYYIVNITEIVAPGSAYPGNEIMRVHSELLDWSDKGSSDIEINVPQQ